MENISKLRERFSSYTDEELQIFNGDNEETMVEWKREDAINDAIDSVIHEANAKEFKAIANEYLKYDGFYEFEKGSEFKVIHITESLIQVEDFLGLRYWIKTSLFDLIEIE